MKIIAYKNLCAKKKTKNIHIYCTPKLFKPLSICMGVVIGMLVLNLIVGNFFANMRASLQNFVNSFVKLFLL